MQSRQFGAAHVNIFFFLIMLVLFLAAVGFGYVTLEENNKLQAAANSASAEAKTLKIQAQVYRHYVDDLAQVIGETGAYAGREGHNYVDPDDPERDITPTPIQNVTLPKRVEQLIADFATQVGVAEAKGLSSFFGLIKNASDAKTKVAADLQSQATRLQAELDAQKTAVTDVRGELQTQTSSLNNELTQRNEDHTAQLSQKDQTIRTANAQFSELREQMSNQAEENARVVAQLEKDKDNLTARVDAAVHKTRLLNPGDSPDGMVIESSESAGLAWINLGRQDMLPVGTTFAISAPGSDEVKAYGVVRRVEPRRAEIRIAGLKDRFRPVVRGDTIRNDLYSPDMQHNIYLMGRFGHPYSRPMVKSLLEQLGNKVHDKIGPGVDLILVGGDTLNEDNSGFTPIEETEEYKQALFYRIEMAPLSKLRAFLKLGDSDLTSSR